MYADCSTSPVFPHPSLVASTHVASPAYPIFVATKVLVDWNDNNFRCIVAISLRYFYILLRISTPVAFSSFWPCNIRAIEAKNLHFYEGYGFYTLQYTLYICKNKITYLFFTPDSFILRNVIYCIVMRPVKQLRKLFIYIICKFIYRYGIALRTWRNGFTCRYHWWMSFLTRTPVHNSLVVWQSHSCVKVQNSLFLCCSSFSFWRFKLYVDANVNIAFVHPRNLIFWKLVQHGTG